MYSLSRERRTFRGVVQRVVDWRKEQETSDWGRGGGVAYKINVLCTYTNTK